ncbi:unnamed protein product [Angiostrongylus costaricensis]|uniref:Peptidase S1 domain-containing protein n=1 Tax=Angiostrongylus costaricensis TaxID=334426 RepID=A0A0R3PLG4_ANGCS|nr:unnamed protein product [Angiostrongylus costaricensis]
MIRVDGLRLLFVSMRRLRLLAESGLPQRAISRVKHIHSVMPFMQDADGGCDSPVITCGDNSLFSDPIVQISNDDLQTCNFFGDNYPVLDKQYWSVYVGSKCSRIELCQNAFNVSKIVVYKHFDYCEKVNDLALMELASDVPYSNGIPICMPDKNMPLSKTVKADGSGLDRKTISIKCAHIIAPSNSLINMGLSCSDLGYFKNL